MKRTLLAAVCVVAALSACGGGENSATGFGDAQGAAAESPRARALAAKVSAVAPDEAARQLLDFAEKSLAQYFPEHQTTFAYGPFKYRAYSNGVVLGVVVASDPTYTMNGVYVMGGGFGAAPTYVGQITQFITPVDPTTPGTAAGNGCYDLALADTEGTRIVSTYKYAGATSGTQTVDSQVGGMTTFEGKQARKTTLKTTGTSTVQGVTTAVSLDAGQFHRRTGDAELTTYGMVVNSTMSVSGMTANMVSKTIWSPALVDKRYGLMVGETSVGTRTGVLSTTTSIPGMGDLPGSTSNLSDTLAVKYLGKEMVTVPAGTFSACKFEEREGNGKVTTHWVVDGKGIPAKWVAVEGGITQTVEASEIQLNGQRL